MRIAFVGKGGSGKTTLTVLFSLLAAKEEKYVWVIDGDINIHTPDLLLGQTFPWDKYLSNPQSTKEIKQYLKGVNKKIQSLEAFRKTTPPGNGSQLLSLGEESFLQKYAETINGISIFVVGAYDEASIGASCYHNNLAIAENILSHTNDKNGVIIMDMVAGTDAFASTLHAQFDVLVFVLEPTKKSMEVYMNYLQLAKEGGIEKDLFVLGNKIKNNADKDFIGGFVPQEKLVGFISQSNYIETHEKRGGRLDLQKWEEENIVILSEILWLLKKKQKDPNIRLTHLKQLHKKYVAQAFIRDRFGDLATQIDEAFVF